MLRGCSCALLGGTQQQNKRQWAETDAQEVPPDREEEFFTVWVTEHWNRWSRKHEECFPCCRCSRTIWMQPYAMCSGMILLGSSQGGWPRWPTVVPSNLTHSGILWCKQTKICGACPNTYFIHSRHHKCCGNKMFLHEDRLPLQYTGYYRAAQISHTFPIQPWHITLLALYLTQSCFHIFFHACKNVCSTW